MAQDVCPQVFDLEQEAIACSTDLGPGEWHTCTLVVTQTSYNHAMLRKENDHPLHTPTLASFFVRTSFGRTSMDYNL